MSFSKMIQIFLILTSGSCPSFLLATDCLHDPGEMTPATYRGIPIKYGSVDAVTGSLDLQVPLGPRLPGRVSWGFNWTYESHSSTHQALGGEFRPAVWPRTSLADRFNYTVLLNGHAVTFAHNFFVDMDAASVLSNRGVDDRKQEALVEANLVNQPQALAFHAEVHPSTDGTKFLILSGWRLVSGSDPYHYFGARMTVLDGTTTISTNLKGVTSVTTAYGDAITITETGLSYGAYLSDDVNWSGLFGPISGCITMANQDGQTLTLTATPTGIQVTNNLGYPDVSMVGNTVQHTRGFAEDYSTRYVRDYGFIPTSMTMDGQITRFTWLPVGAYPGMGQLVLANPVMFSSMTHPSGLVESVGYATTPIKRYADYAFHPRTGQWIGFINGSSWVYASYQYRVVDRLIQDWNGLGKEVIITRVGPDWTESANPAGNPISPRQHTTSIKTYDGPFDDTGVAAHSREVVLTHFQCDAAEGVTWGAPGSPNAEAAYLFATSAIQQVDFKAEDGSIYKTIQYSNYDMQPSFTWSMGIGIPNPLYQPAAPITSWDYPGVPRPGLATISQPNLPVQTFFLQPSYGSTSSTMQNHNVAALNGSTGSPWGAVTAGGNPPCDTVKTSTLSLSPWLQPLSSPQINVLSGSYVSNLRDLAGSIADLGTVATTYDNLDRPTLITTTIEGQVTTEVLTYTGGNPAPDSSVKSVQALPFSGKVGKSHTYGSAPHYWVTSETDLLTGQTTGLTPDDLGREVERVDPSGIATSTRYDSLGRLHYQTTHGTDSVTKTYDYDPAGLWMTETISVAGKQLVTHTTYDAFGHTIQVVNPDGSYQITTFNGFGEKTTQTPWMKPMQANYGVTKWDYDGKGRLVRETDPQGRVVMAALTEPAWDNSLGGVVTTTEDDRGYTHKTVVDFLNQKRRVIDPLGNAAQFSYNAQGKLSRTVFAGQTRSYQYTPQGWMTYRMEPEEGVTQYGDFTAWGYPTITVKKGRTTSPQTTVSLGTELDDLGRPMNLWKIYSDGAADLLRTMAYDPKFVSKLSAMQSYQPNGTLMESYQYDGWGRPISKTVQDDAGATFAVAQTLDGLGNVTSLTYPTGGGAQSRTLTIAYDDKLRPSDVTLGSLRGHMDYDQVSGTEVSQTLSFGNGAVSMQSYDKGELTLVEHRSSSDVLESSALSWTAGGLMLTRGTDTYGYDPFGRLNQATVHGWSDEVITQASTYDARGNRTGSTTTPENTSRPDEAISWTASYDSTNSIPMTLSALDGSTLYTAASYDNFGRLNSIFAIPGSSYTTWLYDDEGQIVSENGTNFLLDAQGLRFRRVQGDGTTTYVVYGFNRDPLSTFVVAP